MMNVMTIAYAPIAATSGMKLPNPASIGLMIISLACCEEDII